jgi:hypothetical protein
MLPQHYTASKPRRPSPDIRVYLKVSALVAWGDNCKWYISLPPGAEKGKVVPVL